MLFIKICGLTEKHAAEAAAVSGADAVGFVFAPSPRRVTPARAKEIAAGLPRGILRVGVFVNPTPEEVRRTVEEVGLDLVQVHGVEAPSFWEEFGPRAIRPVPVGLLPPGPELVLGRPRFLLLDTYRPGAFGGTGKTFPWTAALPYRRLGLPVLIAGGLNPQNVTEALEIARPAGVDVSSGVESAPGKKDPALIAAFIRAVREWEKNRSFNPTLGPEGVGVG